MITGKELATPIYDCTEDCNGKYFYSGHGGLTIFQELSARFMRASLSNPNGNFELDAEFGCKAAETLIAEWNKREQNKNL